MKTNESLQNDVCAPAIQAVMWQATLPAINDLRTTNAISFRRVGAIETSAPIWMPIAPKLPKPQSTYVDISSERS